MAFSGKGRTTGTATLGISCVAEEVDEDVVSGVCQGIYDWWLWCGILKEVDKYSVKVGQFFRNIIGFSYKIR